MDEEYVVYDKDGFCKDLIGMTFEEAETVIKKAGFKARKLYPKTITTAEYRPERFNIILDETTQRVIKITRG